MKLNYVIFILLAGPFLSSCAVNNSTTSEPDYAPPSAPCSTGYCSAVTTKLYETTTSLVTDTRTFVYENGQLIAIDTSSKEIKKSGKTIQK